MNTVLVVDDSRVAFELLRRALTPSGKYSVEFFCKNGEGLLEAYEQHKPDIVVMDIVMEGINGIDLTQTLLGAHPEARIVMITSLSYHEVRENAEAAGAVGYIHKPFQPGQVIEAFDRALAK